MTLNVPFRNGTSVTVVSEDLPVDSLDPVVFDNSLQLLNNSQLINSCLILVIYISRLLNGYMSRTMYDCPNVSTNPIKIDSIVW